jgi:hypothetical protein
MATAGLAFNTMMSDMSRAASYVNTFSVTPAYSGIPINTGMQYQMGMGEALGAVAGLTNPSTPMYMADYRYMANERIARGFGNTASNIAAGGMSLGAGIGGGIAGAAIGTAIFPGVGTVIGGLLGSMAGSAALSPITSGITGIANTTTALRMATPAIFGGQGMGLEQARGVSRDLNKMAISESRDWFGGGGDVRGIMNTVINQGSQFGLFSGTTDTESFKKELMELTKTIRDISGAVRMSKEEMIPLLAEMRQGGFYGAAPSGQAILAGSGMAYGAGVGFKEMHEMGLRGAAMFRGTGIPTSAGYTIGEESLFNVRRMQQLGMISPEAINQLGGVTGAAEQLTAGAGGFVQGEFGRATVAMMMGPGGKVNQKMLQGLLSGQNPADLLSQANIDPIAAMNPMNQQRFWKSVGPEGIQQTQAAWLRSLTKQYQQQFDVGFEDAFAMAFQAAPRMGITPNAANMELFMNQAKNLPRLMAEQKANIIAEQRRFEQDRIDRENDIWGRTGVREVGRGFHRAVTQPIAEGLSTLGDFAGDMARGAGDWYMGRTRIDESAGRVGAAFKLLDVPGLAPSEYVRTGGALTEVDKNTLAKMGKLGVSGGAGGYTWEGGTSIAKAVTYGVSGTAAAGPVGGLAGIGAAIDWRTGQGIGEYDYRQYAEAARDFRLGATYDGKRTEQQALLIEKFKSDPNLKSANDLLTPSTARDTAKGSENDAKASLRARTIQEAHPAILAAAEKSGLAKGLTREEIFDAYSLSQGLRSELGSLMERAATSTGVISIKDAETRTAIAKSEIAKSMGVDEVTKGGVFGAWGEGKKAAAFDKVISDPDMILSAKDYYGFDPNRPRLTDDQMRAKIADKGVKGKDADKMMAKMREIRSNPDRREEEIQRLNVHGAVIADGTIAKFFTEQGQNMASDMGADFSAKDASDIQNNQLYKAITSMEKGQPSEDLLRTKDFAEALKTMGVDDDGNIILQNKSGKTVTVRGRTGDMLREMKNTGEEVAEMGGVPEAGERELTQGVKTWWERKAFAKQTEQVKGGEKSETSVMSQRRAALAAKAGGGGKDIEVYNLIIKALETINAKLEKK